MWVSSYTHHMKSGKSLRYKSSAIKDFYNAIKNIYYLNQFGKQACLTSDFLYIWYVKALFSINVIQFEF